MALVHNLPRNTLPYKSNRGNHYTLIWYDYDGTIILARAINNIQASTICGDWQYLHNILKAKGNDPTFYIMDNEASADMKEEMTKYYVSY